MLVVILVLVIAALAGFYLIEAANIEAAGTYSPRRFTLQTKSTRGTDGTPIPALEFDKKTRLAFEKEMLGLYVSDHPLFGAEDFLARRTEGWAASVAVPRPALWPWRTIHIRSGQC